MDIACVNKLGFFRPKLVKEITDFYCDEVKDFRKADKIFRDVLNMQTDS